MLWLFDLWSHQVVHNLFGHFEQLDSSASTANNASNITASSNNNSPTRRPNNATKSSFSLPETTVAPTTSTGGAHRVHEVVAALRIAADAFQRIPTLTALKSALLLLVKCAQWSVAGKSSSSIIQ